MKAKTKGLFLSGPEGAKIRRHQIGDNEIRFTIPSNADPDTGAWLHHRKLVAWAKDGKFIWVCKGFSS